MKIKTDDFIAFAASEETHLSNGENNFVKIPLGEKTIGIFKVETASWGFFKNPLLYLVCLTDAAGKISFVNNLKSSYLDFPKNFFTFDLYTRLLTNKVAVALLPQIMDPSIRNQVIPQGEQKKNQAKALTITTIQLRQIAEDRSYLRMSFEDVVGSWEKPQPLNFSIGEMIYTIEHPGTLPTDSFLKVLRSGDIKSDTKLFQLAKSIYELQDNLAIIREAVGTDPNWTLDAAVRIKKAIPSNAAKITVYFRGENDSVYPIDFNPRLIEWPKEESAFWPGILFSCYKPKNPVWADDPEMIKFSHSQWLIPWNRITKIVHRKKEIYLQTE